MAELYAIVGNTERARLMLAAEVPYLQLRFKESGFKESRFKESRFKDEPLAPHRETIRGWVRDYPATRIIINDDLEFAEDVGAWGAHLGQEDLDRYGAGTQCAARLRSAQVQVGISTHSDAEIARALACEPALLGFGPLYPTETKQLVNAPQGLQRLREVMASQPLPIVAIGGIGEDTLDAVADTGVAMVAMIAYLNRFDDPTGLHTLMQRLARP